MDVKKAYGRWLYGCTPKDWTSSQKSCVPFSAVTVYKHISCSKNVLNTGQPNQ